MQYFVKQPSVDIVIINWNYARFVAEAINSVRNQSYQDFRCIVVDNGSDDDSVDRIKAAIDGQRQFSLFGLPSNLGHLGAAQWALEHVTGEFVTFLDADDVLFPAYLESHLQAHLAATSPVGFTSSTCVETNATGDLLAAGFNKTYCWEQGEPALRPIERAMRLGTVGEKSYAELVQAVRYLPAHVPSWCWCPGSSNMFRRVLLERLRPTAQGPVFGGVDGFFLPILHALTGSLLIDQPLSAYRVHGSNDHSTLPGIGGVRSEHPRAAAQSFGSYVRMLTWLIEHVDDVAGMAGAGRYWQIIDTAASTDVRSRQAFSCAEFVATLTWQYPRLVELFGETRVFDELRKRLLFPEYLKIISAAQKRRSVIAVRGRAVWNEFRRKSRLLRKKFV